MLAFEIFRRFKNKKALLHSKKNFNGMHITLE